MHSARLYVLGSLVAVAVSLFALPAGAEEPGRIVLRQRVSVVPGVSGRVVEIMCEEGQAVQKGQTLARLEDAPYRLELERAQAQLEIAKLKFEEVKNGSRPEELQMARGELEAAKAQLQLAQTTAERAKRLHATGTLSQEELSKATGDLTTAESRVKRLEVTLALLQAGPRPERLRIVQAEIRLAETEVAQAQWRLGNCTILAPEAGIVFNKKLNLGDFVNPLAAGGPPCLCQIASLSPLQVEVQVPDTKLTQAVGQRCTIRVQALPQQQYLGQVVSVSPVGDPATGTFTVRVDFAPEGDRVRPGMSAGVTFQPREEEKK